MYEENYTKIPNELLEACMSEALNDSERRILLFLIRKIYGWNKTSDRISNSQIEKSLNLAHSTVSLTLKRLKEVGIIKLVQAGKSKKNPNKWSLDLTDFATKLVGMARLVRYDKKKLVGITIHTKEIYTKEKKSSLLEGKSEKLKSGLGLSVDPDQAFKIASQFRRKDG